MVNRDATEIEAHGLRWRVLKDFAAVLPSLDVLKSRRPEQLGRTELVKDNTVRTVMRLPDPRDPRAPGFYVKRYKFKNLRTKLKHLVVPTKARHEWSISLRLQRDGIPTCRVTGIAERRGGGLCREGFLVSEEIAGGVPLRDFIVQQGWRSPGRGAAYKSALVEELARLVARMALLRHYHHDLHVGNLLVKADAPPGKRLYVLDLHRVTRRRMSSRRVLRMLAMLGNSTLKGGIGTVDRVRFVSIFLREWAGRDEFAHGEVKGWFRRAEAAQERLERRVMRSRTRRCVVESSTFTSERREGRRIFRRRDFPSAAVLDVIGLHAQALAGKEVDCIVCKSDGRTQVTLCPCADATSGQTVCVKAFLRASLKDRIKDRLRLRSRAKAAWIALRGFSVRRLPAPEPLAAVESSILAGEPDFVIMQALPGARTLDEFVAACPSAAQHRELGRKVAELLALLAASETWHPDLKPTNILVTQGTQGLKLWVIDMARVRFRRPCGRRQWVRWLVQLNAGLPAEVSSIARMRCLRECARGRWSRSERIEIARAAYEKSLERNPMWLR